jgi:SPOR domain
MLTRGLIVMLVVLNLGVAAWWMWRPESPPRVQEATTPSGIARLQLLRERKGAVPRPNLSTNPAARTVPEPPEPVIAERCYRFGPFADDAALAKARGALKPQVARLRDQSAPASRSQSWRVIVPPAADRDAANALAERIKQAGFSDLFVIANGDAANAIVLGQFSSEERARQHAASLVDAGFSAQAEALGATKTPERWLLAATTEAFNSANARRISGAAEARNIDCAMVR